MHYLKNQSGFFSAHFKTLLATAVLATLTACGNSGGDKNSQSIVRVNDDEITVHQVNFQMQRMQVTEKNKDAMAKQVISGLIDRQLLVQEALKTELDRNPQVMQALEESKQQLLAKAYLESKVANVAKPTDAEIADYRNKHPELFENRKLYAIEELTFTLDAALNGELDGLSDSAKTLDEVIAWLDAKQVKYGRNKVARAAEALPSGLLAKFSQLNNGELLFVHGPNGYSVARLLETKSQPIGMDDAKPIIARILVNEKQKSLASSEMARLRQASKIVYTDKKFETNQQATSGAVKSPAEQNQSGNSQSPVPASTPETTTNPSAKPAEDKKTENKKVDASVEKGLSGL